MTKSILILGTDPCRSFELQDAIIRARMDVDTHVRQHSDDQDWNGADLILCSDRSPDLAMLLAFVEQRKPATRVVVIDEQSLDSGISAFEVKTLIENQLAGKLQLVA